MKITINNAAQFREAFKQTDYADRFSYDGLGLLFDYFDQWEPDYEFDAVEICCYYTELCESDIRSDYSIASDRDIEDYLQENTAYIGKTESGTYVFSQF